MCKAGAPVNEFECSRALKLAAQPQPHTSKFMVLFSLTGLVAVATLNDRQFLGGAAAVRVGERPQDALATAESEWRSKRVSRIA